MLRKNTLILIGVFAALVIVMVLLQRNQAQNPTVPESDAPTAPPPTYLFPFAPETFVGLLVEGAGGQVIALQ